MAGIPIGYRQFSMNSRHGEDKQILLTIDGIFDLAANKGLTPRSWVWKPLQTYNGFIHVQRVRKWQAIHLGIQLGLILPADNFLCDICGARSTEALTSYHSEDYASMTGHYPLCKSCHTRVHGRFGNRAAWLAFICKYGNGTKWFELLT
jgi:hypothetical protein